MLDYEIVIEIAFGQDDLMSRERIHLRFLSQAALKINRQPTLPVHRSTSGRLGMCESDPTEGIAIEIRRIVGAHHAGDLGLSRRDAAPTARPQNLSNLLA